MKVDIGELSEIESRMIKNFNNKELNQVTKDLVNVYLIPRLMSTFPGQYGVNSDFCFYQRIVRDSLMGKKTKITKQQYEDSYAYLKHLENKNVIRFNQSNTRLDKKQELHNDLVSLTDEAIEMEKILKDGKIISDDYAFANALWCLSQANCVKESERETRFANIHKILHVITLAMAEYDEGRMVWHTIQRPTKDQLINWIKLVGKHDDMGKSEMSYEIAAEYLNKQEVQSMLSNSGLVLFQRSKISLKPMCAILEQFNEVTLPEISRLIRPTEKISKKVNQVIESEIKSKELAP
jgi:hypothetical protein